MGVRVSGSRRTDGGWGVARWDERARWVAALPGERMADTSAVEFLGRDERHDTIGTGT